MANHLIMFLGRPPQTQLSPIETAMDGLLRVAATSTLLCASHTDLFERLIIVTSDPDFVPPAGVELVRDEPDTEFEFGKALWRVVQSLPPADGVVYVGAGAGVLLTPLEWRALVAAIESGPTTVTANNFFSADLVGWKPATALGQLAELPESDNNLAWALCQLVGLSWQQMLPGNSRTARTIFDIDTPTDGAVLKLWLENQHDDSDLANYLSNCADFETSRIKLLLAELSRFEGRVLVIGRVSGGVHRLLDLRSHGQTRILSEERGMRASGRESNGSVVSLAGFMLDELGPGKFFERLARLGTVAVIDSRVLFAHQGLKPNRADRFNSDAFQLSEISDPRLRAFTEAALEAHARYNFPVVLGGHSLVAGDMMLLLDMLPPRFG